MGSIWHRMDDSAQRRPGAALGLFAVISALLWALQCALLRTLLPLDGVESVCWGSRLQWGYFKHPPLAAWIAWAAARLTGYSDIAQYLLTYGSLAVGVWFVYLLAREFQPPPRAALAAMPLYFLHYYTLAPAAFCPNSIQLALQPVMAWLFLRCVRGRCLGTWIALGIVSAAAFLGKYSAGILLLAMAIAVLAIPSWRRVLATPGPWLSGALFLVCVTPHILWLARNDFICLTYVEESIRPMGAIERLWFPFYLMLAAVYPMLVAAALYLLAGWKCVERPEAPATSVNPDFLAFRWYCVIVTAVPAAVVVLLAALGHSVQPMWLSTMASWSALTVLVFFPRNLPERAFLRLYRLLCTGTVIALAASSADYMLRSRPRTHLDTGALCQAADECMAEAVQGADVPLTIVVGERWLANTLQYYHSGHPFSADIHDPQAMSEAAARLTALRESGTPAAFLLVAKRPGDMAVFRDMTQAAGLSPALVRSEVQPRRISFRASFGTERQVFVYMQRLEMTSSVADKSEEVYHGIGE